MPKFRFILFQNHCLLSFTLKVIKPQLFVRLSKPNLVHCLVNTNTDSVNHLSLIFIQYLNIVKYTHTNSSNLFNYCDIIIKMGCK